MLASEFSARVDLRGRGGRIKGGAAGKLRGAGCPNAGGRFDAQGIAMTRAAECGTVWKLAHPPGQGPGVLPLEGPPTRTYAKAPLPFGGASPQEARVRPFRTRSRKVALRGALDGGQAGGGPATAEQNAEYGQFRITSGVRKRSLARRRFLGRLLSESPKLAIEPSWKRRGRGGRGRPLTPRGAAEGSRLSPGHGNRPTPPGEHAPTLYLTLVVSRNPASTRLARTFKACLNTLIYVRPR